MLMKPQKMCIAILLGALFLSRMWVLSAVAQDRLRDQEPGSFLVFPYFSIAGNTNTTLCMTNTADGPFGAIATSVQFNFVCQGVKGPNPFCNVLDPRIAFTYHGTVCIDLKNDPRYTPPCEQGFAVAYAITNTGIPQSHNFLIGHAQISAPNVLAEANAIAVQSPKAAGTTLGAPSPATGDYGLTFGSTANDDYVALPNVLHGTFRASGPGLTTFLVVLTLDTISGGQNPVSRIAFDFWNANEVRYSAAHEFVCWDAVRLDAIDPRFAAAGLGTPFGSLRITATSNCPIPGTCPPLPVFTPTILGTLVDIGPGMALGVRPLFHTGARATTYFPQ